MESWAALFERAAEFGVDEGEVRETLDALRDDDE